MSTSASTKPKRPRTYVPVTALAKSVEFDEAMMQVVFTDGRVLCVPLAWFPVLHAATPEQRARYEIGGGGRGPALAGPGRGSLYRRPDGRGGLAVGVSSHTGRPTEPLSGLRAQSLTKLDELLLDCAPAKARVQDRGGIDKLGRFLEVAGVEVGQRQPIPGLEPGS